MSWPGWPELDGLEKKTEGNGQYRVLPRAICSVFSPDSGTNSSSSYKRAVGLQPNWRRATVWVARAREEWDKILACARMWIREDEEEKLYAFTSALCVSIGGPERLWGIIWMIYHVQLVEYLHKRSTTIVQPYTHSVSINYSLPSIIHCSHVPLHARFIFTLSWTSSPLSSRKS